jgi:hypothetical protein
LKQLVEQQEAEKSELTSELAQCKA